MRTSFKFSFLIGNPIPPRTGWGWDGEIKVSPVIKRGWG
jgi:hypothetical protein